MNYNQVLGGRVWNYLMMPGDGTMYRFGWQRVIQGDSAYAYDSGIGDGEGWIWFYINMPSGTGVSLIEHVEVKSYVDHPEYRDVTDDYHLSHGMRSIVPYTFRAVLLALSVLVDEPHHLEKAAKKMMELQHGPSY
jgi:hypothetical protein